MICEYFSILTLLTRLLAKADCLEDCLTHRRASEKLKNWAVKNRNKKVEMKLSGISLTMLEGLRGQEWYLVSQGWEGAFYYEIQNTSKCSGYGERPGAYLYPDYSTAIVGVWKDHLLVHGRTTQLVVCQVIVGHCSLEN